MDFLQGIFQNVYEELRANARECLGTKEFLQLELKQNKISMSKMFKQYSEDFGPGVDDVKKDNLFLIKEF